VTSPITSATRLPQLGQAVERLLDAIAANEHDGVATYQLSPNLRGRWQSGEHSCGNNTIHTAVRNKLVTIEVAGSNIRGLALTPAGRHHVQARAERRAASR
jgi:hypothetical protein